MITFSDLKEFNTYELRHLVTSCEVDPQNRLRPAHFLRLMQAAADLHSAQLGVSPIDIENAGLMVVITRNSVKIHRYPKAYEELRVVTLHRLIKGSRMYRDFLFFSGDHVIAEATNEYCVLDRQTRRPTRPTIYSSNPAFCDQDYVPGNPQPSKITAADGSFDRGFRKVMYSHLDCNGHMNNANYCDFALDAMPASLMNCVPDFFETNYSHEALYQTSVQLFYSFDSETDCAFIVGELTDKSCFTMKMHFNELPILPYAENARKEAEALEKGL